MTPGRRIVAAMLLACECGIGVALCAVAGFLRLPDWLAERTAKPWSERVQRKLNALKLPADRA